MKESCKDKNSDQNLKIFFKKNLNFFKERSFLNLCDFFDGL
jgi:hypothetical protein